LPCFYQCVYISVKVNMKCVIYENRKKTNELFFNKNHLFILNILLTHMVYYLL